MNPLLVVGSCSLRAEAKISAAYHSARITGNGISLHYVLKNCSNKRQWMHKLKMGKPFTQYHVICSEHFTEDDFIHAKSAKRHLKMDVLPSRNLPVTSIDKFNVLSSPVKKRNEERHKRYLQRAERRVLGSVAVNVPTVDLNLIMDCDNENELNVTTADVNLQTNDNKENENPEMNTCEVIATQCTRRFVDASTQTDPIEEKVVHVNTGTDPITVKKVDVSTKTTKKCFLLKNILNEEQLTSCTGINSFDLFNGVSVAVENYNEGKSNCSLTTKDQVMLTLLKLKINCSFVFLSVLFNIDRRTASRYFKKNIRIMSVFLKNFIISPTRDSIRENLPYSFMLFPDTVFVLDCTEIPVCSPMCIRCRTQTWSYYKGRHTIKMLLAVTPDGVICYVGSFYGGKASDNFLFTKNELLNKCKSGDAIMVDKSFRIENQCKEKGVSLIRPAFKEGNEQLGYEDCEHSRQVASARIHIERVIERIKNFRIFHDEVQWNYFDFINDIMITICGLVNLPPPILRDGAFS